MDRPQRILIAVIATIVVGAMSAFNTVNQNNNAYQEHPVAAIIGSVIVSPLAGVICYWVTGRLAGRKDKNKPSLVGGLLSGDEDNQFYDEVAQELKNKTLIPGVWARAYAETSGDEAKARALYIKYRVADLRKEERNTRIKLQTEEKERKKEEAKNRAIMKSRLMTICRKCGYAGCMDPAFIPPGGHDFCAATCKCPKCSDRFDWYYVPSTDFPKAQS